MLRFILVVLANVKRGPYLIPKMRKMFHHPERYSEQVRYAFAQKLINYMKSSGKINGSLWHREFTFRGWLCDVSQPPGQV